MDLRAVRGVTRLAFDGVDRMTDLVEAMHLNIAAAPLPFGKAKHGRTRGITGLVYEAIREISHLVGEGADGLMSLAPADDEPLSASSKQEAWRAAINGVLGDHLEASGNPLALPMRFRRHGRALDLESATPRVLVLVHGLCMNDLQWQRHGHDHGEALAKDLGYTPVYLQYNSGRHVSTNGRDFAAMLEQLIAQWPTPVEELCIVGHSLGGLVARSACHYGAPADHTWLGKLRKLVFLGTPHHGSPLERHGNWFQAAFGITPYSTPLGRLGMVRSAGVTDLRHGNVLDQDWNAADRFEHHHDTRRALPLPTGVACFATAATLGRKRGDLKDQWLGDGLVPVPSALGRHKDPAFGLAFADENRRTYFEASHWDLLSRADVYQQLRDWLA
jgi:hypothetical protein